MIENKEDKEFNDLVKLVRDYFNSPLDSRAHDMYKITMAMTEREFKDSLDSKETNEPN